MPLIIGGAMGIKLVNRSAWGARAPRSAAAYLSSTRGVKVHYTGSPENVAMGEPDGHHLCDDRVRGIQNGHMDGNGWNDIGYSAVVCCHGYVYIGRGPHALPAANGEGLNSGHYAVCALVGNKGLTKPTPAMLHGIRDAIDWLRKEGGAGHEIKGHRDGYATDCPGAPLYAWVRAGAPRPNEEEDDMALSADDIQKIAEAVKNVSYNGRGDLAKQSWQAAKDGMDALLPLVRQIATNTGTDQVDEEAIVRGVLAGLDPAAIAAAVAEALPPELAEQVVTELGARLASAQPG
jgi:hypothetical protein